jgi:hypothetical protein
LYQNPVAFPAVSNRESFVQTVEIFDDQTGDLISLTDADDDVIYQIFLEISPPRDHHHGGGGYSTYSGPYYSDSGDVRIFATLDDYLSVVDTGTINVQIPFTVMQKLHGATYDIYMRIVSQADDDARQLFVGKLPVVFGGHGGSSSSSSGGQPAQNRGFSSGFSSGFG